MFFRLTSLESSRVIKLEQLGMKRRLWKVFYAYHKCGEILISGGLQDGEVGNGIWRGSRIDCKVDTISSKHYFLIVSPTNGYPYPVIISVMRIFLFPWTIVWMFLSPHLQFEYTELHWLATSQFQRGVS